MRVNMNKAKVMISGERRQDGSVVYVPEMFVAFQYNVLVVTSGYTRKLKGSMYKVMRSFICRGCLNPVISTGHTSVDIGAHANLEVVEKFCYLGVVLSVDGDADAAVEARI